MAAARFSGAAMMRIAGQIERALGSLGQGVTITRPPDLVAAMADVLADGKTLAWFRGGAEFGPRALGHRSILADPRRPELRDYIIARVKFREDFRPFAPAVRAEEAPPISNLDRDSPLHAVRGFRSGRHGATASAPSSMWTAPAGSRPCGGRPTRPFMRCWAQSSTAPASACF